MVRNLNTGNSVCPDDVSFCFSLNIFSGKPSQTSCLQWGSIECGQEDNVLTVELPLCGWLCQSFTLQLVKWMFLTGPDMTSFFTLRGSAG